jgi:hypothetical protein
MDEKYALAYSPYCTLSSPSSQSANRNRPFIVIKVLDTDILCRA